MKTQKKIAWLLSFLMIFSVIFGNINLNVAANGEGTTFKFNITNTEGSVENAVQYKLNNTGDWVTAGADAIDIASANTIAIRVTRASNESVIAEAYEKDNKLTVAGGIYGDGEVFDLTTGVSYELIVTFTANTPGGSSENLELSGATSVSNGTFTTANGTATVEIGGEAYTGTANMWSIPALDTQIKVVLTANEGFKGVLRGGGFSIPDSCVSVSGQVTTYTFTLAVLGATELNNFKSLSMAFESNSAGGDPVPSDAISFVLEGNALDKVTVEYSTDSGGTWNAIADRVTLNDTVASAQIKVTNTSGAAVDITSANIPGTSGNVMTAGTVYTVSEKQEYRIQIDKTVYTVAWTYQDDRLSEDALVKNGTVKIVSAVKDGGSQWSGIEPAVLPGENNNQQDANGGRVAIIPGSVVTVEIVPDYKYQFVAGTLNGQAFAADDNKVSTFTFTMPSANLHLSALFTPSSDKMVIGSGTGVTGATISGGENVISSGNLELTVTNSTISDADKDKLQASSAASGVSVDKWLEVDLQQVVNKGKEGEYWTTDKEELSAKITITLYVGTGLSTAKEYVVVREHKGVYEQIPATYDPQAGTLTFQSDKFSEYAVGTVVSADNVLDTINDNWSGSGSDAGSTVDTLKANFTVQEIASAVQAANGSVNTTLLEKLKALEADYISEKSITQLLPEVTSGSAAAGLIDQNAVSVVGANLNLTNTGDSIKLCIGDVAVSDTPITISSAYSKAVQVDITLLKYASGSGTGVPMTGDLRMPVTITMPVPTGIDASRLVILHDKDGDGNSDENVPYSLASGKVTFTVTHCSTFAFAEKTVPAGGTPEGGTGTSTGSQTTSDKVEEKTEKVKVAVIYTVVRGDTLNKIAYKHNMTLSALLALNPQIKNPNRIYPGQEIVVGYTYETVESDVTAEENSEAEYYTVKRGDYLYKIARENGITFAQLLELNPGIMKQKYIYAGQKIRVK
ncbi:MAG: LysM peptidoglycan-binding domain-containing protein [Lachnospiraceae bacterium]